MWMGAILLILVSVGDLPLPEKSQIAIFVEGLVEGLQVGHVFMQRC